MEVFKSLQIYVVGHCFRILRKEMDASDLQSNVLTYKWKVPI